MSSSIFTSDSDHLSFSGFLDNILVDFPSENLAFSPSGSDISTPKTNSSCSGSDDAQTYQRKVKLIDQERRKKRKISNRESAKRSRERKQKHLENLKNLVTKFKKVNQELTNRLRFVNHNGQIVQRENQRLRLESVMLQQRLYDLQRLLHVQPELHHPLLTSAWPCNNNVFTINDQIQTSLITF